MLLLVAAVCIAGALASGPRAAGTSLFLTLVGTFCGVLAAAVVLLGAGDWEWRPAFALGGQMVHLRLDGVSAVFLFLLSVVGAAGAAYAREYWGHEASSGRGRSWWNAMVLSMGLVLVISNGLHFLMAWEAFALCGYFLITLDNRRLEVRKAGWLYLAASHAGTLALVAFFAALAARTGSWDLGPMTDRQSLAPLFWIALFGFGMKAGFFPCHIWLPPAHACSPSHVSAIMSGVAIKIGVYGIVRFSGWLPMPAGAGNVILGIGATSALLGIAFAMAQNDLKRLLAYCSVENVGIILIGLGGAVLARTHGGPAWGILAMGGALLHVWNHGFFKSLLFFGAGSVLHATGTREMSRLGGLGKRMPWTSGLFLTGVLAVAALPPLNGFVSEWLIYSGLFEAVAARARFAWLALPAVILLATAGALALAAFTKAGAVVFLGAARTKSAAHARECGWWMRAPMLAAAGACVAVGLAPWLVWKPILRAVSAWNPAWPPAVSPGSPSPLGSAQVALAALAAAAVFMLWRKVRCRAMRRELTWDCGCAAPTPHMQYTSGSFSGIVTGWFAWVFRSDRKLRRPRGFFPESSLHLERVSDTVLDQMLMPVGNVITRLAILARGLQHGRLQAYILYLVAGLAAVGFFVFLQ